MDLDFFELDDVGFEKPVGGGKGKERKGKTTTHFEVSGKGLAGKESGALVSKTTPTSTRASHEIAGTYSVNFTHRTTKENLGGFKLSANKNGSFVITDLSLLNRPDAPKSLTGRFAAGRDGTVYTAMMMPKVGPNDLGFDFSEVNLFRPLAETQGKGSGGCGSGTIPLCICAQPQVCSDHSATFRVTIVDKRTDSPIPFATASLQETTPEAPPLFETADGEGVALFVVAPGAYFLSAVKVREYAQAPEIQVHVVEGETHDKIRLEPLTLITVSGNIFSHHGTSTSPLPDALVQLSRPGFENIEFSAVSDTQGRYSIQRVPTGPYKVVIKFQNIERGSFEIDVTTDSTVHDFVV
jgi:hypothetical protein